MFLLAITYLRSKTLIAKMVAFQNSITHQSTNVLQVRKQGEAVINGNLHCMAGAKNCLYSIFRSMQDDKEFKDHHGDAIDGPMETHSALVVRLENIDIKKWTIGNLIEEATVAINLVHELESSYLALLACKKGLTVSKRVAQKGEISKKSAARQATTQQMKPWIRMGVCKNLFTYLKYIKAIDDKTIGLGEGYSASLLDTADPTFDQIGTPQWWLSRADDSDGHGCL
jgi:hypothetical protein